MKVAPNLFCIGGMRCGSTTLHDLLGQHPDIFMSKSKEPMFWIAEADRRAGNWQPGKGKYRTEATYSSLFADAGDFLFRGESSHYLYRPDTAPLISMACPDSRIVISLRDPAERLFSEFLFRVRRGELSGSFEDFAYFDTNRTPTGMIRSIGKKSRINKGLQGKLVHPWLEQFGRDCVRTILFEDIQTNSERTVQSLFDWLGVDSGFSPIVTHTQKSGIPRHPGLFALLDRGGGQARKVAKALVPPGLRKRLRANLYGKSLERPKPSIETMTILRSFYRQDIELLGEITGHDLSQWLAKTEAD